MKIFFAFSALAFAAFTIALPAPLSNDATLVLKSSKILARAPAEKATLKNNINQKCYLGGSCGFFGGGSSGSSSSISGAFSRTSFESQSFISDSSLHWQGIQSLGFRSTDPWSNNFDGASRDFAIFTNNFAGMTQAFRGSQLSWSGVQGAITTFGSDFSNFCNQLSSFKSFGGFSGGIDTFQSYFVQCMQTFQAFLGSIQSRFGGNVFQQGSYISTFQSGFQSLFQFASTVGIDCYSLLQRSQIDFGLFQQCGIPIESWLGGGGGGSSSSFGSSKSVGFGSSKSVGFGSSKSVGFGSL